MEQLPADEQTIERYGSDASNGVILITLKYDSKAVFTADSHSFDRNVARRIKRDEIPWRGWSIASRCSATEASC